MKKKCSVVALPSDYGPVGQFTDTREHVSAYKMGWDIVTSYDYIQAYHLYIISDDEIEVGDTCLFNESTMSCYQPEWNLQKVSEIQNGWIHYEPDYGHMPEQVYKIIASTNSSLNLPAIPEWFIKEYAEKQTSEVLIDYHTKNQVLRYTDIDTDITSVGISTVKETWTRDEIEFVIDVTLSEYIQELSFLREELLKKFDSVEQVMREFAEDEKADAYKRDFEDLNFYEGR